MEKYRKNITASLIGSILVATFIWIGVQVIDQSDTKPAVSGASDTYSPNR